MQINLKPGGGGLLQPYKGKGNGDESGEYTNKPESTLTNQKRDLFNKETFLNESKDFCDKSKSTKEYLYRTMTKDEIDSVVRYSNYMYGTQLNRAILENNLTQEQQRDVENIVKSIKKHYLPSVKVYRGIKISKEDRERYLKDAENKTLKYGRLITSTTRRLEHAFLNAKPTSDKPCPVVFECSIPANYNGLSIEDIAFDRTEQEILLSEPTYYIDSIEQVTIGKITYDVFHIKLYEV